LLQVTIGPLNRKPLKYSVKILQSQYCR
jgi:hypothetical protein